MGWNDASGWSDRSVIDAGADSGLDEGRGRWVVGVVGSDHDHGVHTAAMLFILSISGQRTPDGGLVCFVFREEDTRTTLLRDIPYQVHNNNH